MRIIVGLGNPGNGYNFTRHNFGFLALDFYAKINGIEWKAEPKFKAMVARDGDTLLVKPQTFYNEVGTSVEKMVHFYKVDPSEDLLVVADDFNLPYGDVRFRRSGSAGGNNGLKSTMQHLGDGIFPRLRLGTGNEPMRKQLGDTDFVLSKFTPDEREKLPQILQNVVKLIENPPK
ncbi:MAG: aminoacyl-tRNA hydrolase [Candidatus Saccharimonadales bacterium]